MRLPTKGVEKLLNLKSKLKNLLFFNEPAKDEEFVLQENPDESIPSDNRQSPVHKSVNKKNNKRKDRGIIKKLFNNKSDNKSDNSNNGKSTQTKSQSNLKGEKVSRDIRKNLDYMKNIYSIPQNGDMVLREFDIVFKDKTIPAFILFFDGMVDRRIINQAILQPLMILSNINIKGNENNVAEYVRKHLLPQNQVIVTKEYSKVIFEINFGGCGIFIDGIDVAFGADVKGWEHRNIQRPNTEQVIRGPQEGFGEILRINTALVRKILKDENLIVEDVLIGNRSKTPCSMLYIKDLTNDSLVQEVRKRLNDVCVDYLIDSGELEQLIEDNTFVPAPQMIVTERPDRVSSLISEGKVAVIVHGSPFALVVPATFWGLIHSPEDSFVRFPYANLLRFIRIFAIFIALLLPGFFIAITNFHHEMIPTDLLLAIEASREKVPFPSVVELLIMSVSFELIREAGIRIPGPIGPTLSIIGALILGQAAVEASIVSPILIIVVAVTGIASFAVPDFYLGYAFRVLRFIYLALGATAGFLGITLGLFVHGLWLVGTKSFGVPFMAPFAPVTHKVSKNDITRGPIWRQEKRPDYLNTKKQNKQPEISRKWKKKNKGNK